MAISAEALALMASKGLTIDDVVEIAKALEPARTSRQERNRRYYEKKKGVPESDTERLKKTSEKDVLHPPIEEDHTPHNSSLRSVRDQAKAAFENEFWPAYPKRQGSNPRQPAEAKFVRICETGVSPATIVDGARRYAASVAEAEPRFTAQALTWLNQGRWNDDFTPAAQPPPRQTKQPGTLPFGFRQPPTHLDAMERHLERLNQRRGQQRPSEAGTDRDEPEIIPPARAYAG